MHPVLSHCADLISFGSIGNKQLESTAHILALEGLMDFASSTNVRANQFRGERLTMSGSPAPVVTVRPFNGNNEPETEQLV